jgi:hypothetical protein
MERLGTQRAAQFHWNATAQKTLDVYREVVETAALERTLNTASVPIR